MKQRHAHPVEPQVALSDAELMEACVQQSSTELAEPNEAHGEPVPHPEGAPEGLVVISAVLRP